MNPLSTCDPLQFTRRRCPTSKELGRSNTYSREQSHAPAGYSHPRGDMGLGPAILVVPGDQQPVVDGGAGIKV